MAVSVIVRPRQNATKSHCRQNKVIQHRKPTNLQLQEIRPRYLSLEMWVCGFLLNDVGFCVSQFLNPY